MRARTSAPEFRLRLFTDGFETAVYSGDDPSHLRAEACDGALVQRCPSVFQLLRDDPIDGGVARSELRVGWLDPRHRDDLAAVAPAVAPVAAAAAPLAPVAAARAPPLAAARTPLHPPDGDADVDSSSPPLAAADGARVWPHRAAVALPRVSPTRRWTLVPAPPRTALRQLGLSVDGDG